MGTSVLFWVVGSTLPKSEPMLCFFAKLVSVLSFLNYMTWTGRRHIVGVLDYIAVHSSVLYFLWTLRGRGPVFFANVFGVGATFVAWKSKKKAKHQVIVHLIALLNLYLFGVLASRQQMSF